MQVIQVPSYLVSLRCPPTSGLLYYKECQQNPGPAPVLLPDNKEVERKSTSDGLTTLTLTPTIHLYLRTIQSTSAASCRDRTSLEKLVNFPWALLLFTFPCNFNWWDLTYIRVRPPLSVPMEVGTLQTITKDESRELLLCLKTILVSWEDY